MAEVPSERNSVDYAKQQAPYSRNMVEKERWAHIAAENAVMALKLANIRREPPASFHAPRGSQTVREGQRRRQERAGKAQSDMPETQHYVPPAPWPRTAPAHQVARHSKAQREVDIANGHVAAKLRETYRHHAGSLLEKHKLGVGFDCNDRWAQRTALYDAVAAGTAHASMSTSAAGGLGGSVLDLEQASVPKSLSVAHCSGCGARCFFAADGPRLMRCRTCRSAWYCSEVCAKLDYRSHKALCRYATTSHWAPGGVRPTEDCWVSNAAMAEVRADLRRRAAAVAAAATAAASTSGPGSGPASPRRRPASAAGSSPREMQRCSVPGGGGGGGGGAEGTEALGGEVEVSNLLEAKYRQLRERELAAERELADVEYRANHGLDGPRPCMFVMKRFAGSGVSGSGVSGPGSGVEPGLGGGGGGSGGGRRPASAGPRVRGGGNGAKEPGAVRKKPALQATASFL